MKQNNDVFAADSDSLAVDIACYQAMFEKYLRETVETNGRTDPEITGPILAAYNVAGPGIMQAMITAFIAGINAGLALSMDLENNKISNSTNIE